VRRYNFKGNVKSARLKTKAGGRYNVKNYVNGARLKKQKQAAATKSKTTSKAPS